MWQLGQCGDAACGHTGEVLSSWARGEACTSQHAGSKLAQVGCVLKALFYTIRGS